MSLKLLKRELEKELEDLEHKKVKTDDRKVKKKKKVAKKDGFVFNDKDHSKEEDYTKECLRNIGQPFCIVFCYLYPIRAHFHYLRKIYLKAPAPLIKTLMSLGEEKINKHFAILEIFSAYS